MMSIEFRLTMDPCSRDVYVDEKLVGSIQWHRERVPCFVATRPGNPFVLPLSVMKKVVKQLETEVGRACYRNAKTPNRR